MPYTPKSFYKHTVAPCKDCAERAVGCHGTCEKYKDWKKNEGAEKAKMIKAYKTERALEDYQIKEKIKNQKRNRLGVWKR